MINQASEIQGGVDNTAPIVDAIKIMHITSGLGVGGAEAILIDVLKHSDNQKICNYVVCLGSPVERFDINSFEMPQITYLGIQKSLLSWLSGFRTLRNLLREHQPNLVHTWMYHASLMEAILRKFGKDEFIEFLLCIFHFPPNARAVTQLSINIL